MNKGDAYKNLISLLKIFKNRPYHLSRYLLEHEALTDSFLEKLVNSEKLNKFSDKNYINSYFTNISQMENFYNSLLDEINTKYNKKDDESLALSLNKRLSKLIAEEKYEEAAALRDFMIKHAIKKIDN
jgi:hypothetical protein